MEEDLERLKKRVTLQAMLLTVKKVEELIEKIDELEKCVEELNKIEEKIIEEKIKRRIILRCMGYYDISDIWSLT